MEPPKYNVNEIINNLLKKYNTLLDCPVKFHGDYGGQKVQQFIEYIKSYKIIKSISDEQALKELGYLLTDHAYSWWHRRKCHFTTWSEAITALQNQYCRQRPAFLVYKDIFEHKYEDYTKETDFIDDKYELLTELSDPKQSEKNKLDMIFALLPQNVQTKLEYGFISSVAELREQIVKLRKDKDSETNNATLPTTTNQANEGEVSNNTTVNNMETVEPKVEQNVVNSETEASNVQNNEINQSDSSGTEVMPHTICIVNDKDPIIKVRRTEDLMPPAVIKSENNGHDDANDTTMTEQQEEFIHVNHQEQSSENLNFQIDIDIMDQINTIIDESEMNCDSNQSVHHTPIMSVQENATNTTIGFLLNGETTIHAEVSKKPHPAVAATNNPMPRKAKLRCSYCRKFNHMAQDCLKRAKHMQLFPDKFLARERKMENIANNVKNNNNNDDIEVSKNETLSNETTATTYTPFSTSTTMPLSGSLTSCAATFTTLSSPTIMTCVTAAAAAAPANPTVSLSNSSLSQTTSTTYSHITTITSNPPTPTASLTTKLIAPINGPCPSKLLAAKLRNNNNGPSPKCHQCGTVGFYKSICPNCSPIYNSNQQYK
ncbi:uncharacterized protein isoform X2 [Musca autumnalis]|uniref:uncharacterized protein isoform X2 n=1 Tax=Musca autumnalis TaxID=221902 RepID=UPI003CEDFE5D